MTSKPLKNARHERVVLNLLSGMPGYEAYIEAGFAAKGARANASRLIAKDNIKERLKALKSEVALEVTQGEVARVMTVEERKARLTELAEEDNATQYGFQRAPNITAIAELNKMGDVERIAQQVTGRRGDYGGRINIS